jgi:autotransporter strand-loop-strand O-heptosyltransferase
VFNKKLDLSDKRVYISLDSKSLGDTLAWFPAVEEFRKKHKCKVICSTFQNDFFKKTYPEIEFIKPGDEVHDVKALYSIGWYYGENGELNPTMNPNETKNQPMQKTAFDILGLEYQEVVPKLSIPTETKKKQVAIAIHATCQAKYWNNPTGWQEVVDWCSGHNYEVVLISREDSGFMGNIQPTGIRKLPSGPIEAAISEISKSEAFIGIGSGLSWLAWALGTPTILISGFSHAYTEPLKNTARICSPAGKCAGCFNTHRLDPSDWNWCPVHKGTDRQFECSKLITSDSVISQLKTILGLV